MEIKVGDFVRILGNSYGLEYEGRIGKLTASTGMVSTKEGLERHTEDGEDFHLCFFEDEYELVGPLRRLKPNPGDIVECVGYVDTHNYYWWTVGKKYVVTADGTPADNDGNTYGEYDDPQPAILFAIVSRATDQEKEEPVVEKEWDTLKNLNVKPGDVVAHAVDGEAVWTVLAGKKLWSHQLDEVIAYGLWDQAATFKIVARNSETPMKYLNELELAPGDVVMSANPKNFDSMFFPYGEVFTIGEDDTITAADGSVLCTEIVAHGFLVLKQTEVKQMEPFQVGDRVRIIGPIRTAKGSIGDTGTIEAIKKDGRLWDEDAGEYYEGVIYDINGWWYGEDAIELVAHHTLEELGVKPGDVVACYNGLHEGTEYMVRENWKEWGGAPEAWWEIVSRAEDETGTLQKLNLKEGDVVAFVKARENPRSFFYPKENVVFNGYSAYGIIPELDDAIWKVVYRADVTIGSLKEIGAKPGDTVELVENGICAGSGVGLTGVVVEDSAGLHTRGENMDRGDDVGHKFKIVTRAEEEKEEEEEEPEMMVGDRVRVIDNTCYHGFDIDQIVVFDNKVHGSLRFHPKDDPEDFWYMTTNDFVRVEDEAQVFYQVEGIGFFEKEPPCYDKRLVLNHATGTFTLTDF